VSQQKKIQCRGEGPNAKIKCEFATQLTLGSIQTLPMKQRLGLRRQHYRKEIKKVWIYSCVYEKENKGDLQRE
jgi:hypothetical protein